MKYDFAETLQELISGLTLTELEKFLISYNNYIQNFYDEHGEGCYPVSMLEYFNNDYQE